MYLYDHTLRANKLQKLNFFMSYFDFYVLFILWCQFHTTVLFVFLK
jgi:hypothetical protein